MLIGSSPRRAQLQRQLGTELWTGLIAAAVLFRRSRRKSAGGGGTPLVPASEMASDQDAELEQLFELTGSPGG